MASRFRLDGKVAVVTGASSGLGVTFATALAEAGADVAICARSRAGLELTAERIATLGRRAYHEQADVSDWDAIDRFIHSTIRELGRIDVLVNNAGVQDTRFLRSENLEPDALADEIRINLIGTWHGCRAVAAHMLRRGSGSIINISSIFATSQSEFRSIGYSAAKAGVNNLTRSLAFEWADRNVRVNAIAPGTFLTAMSEKALGERGMKEWVESRIPQRRLGVPDELVGPIIFLASDASSYVTGAVVHVDGGWSIGAGANQIEPLPFDGWDSTGRGIPLSPDAE